MARRDITGAVDFAHLETYAGHDAGIIDEVLGLFTEQARTWERLLDPAGPGWRDAAHSLKGSALALGAVELATVCGEAESADGAALGVRTVLAERVRDALDRTLADVAAYRHARLLDGLRTPR